MGAAAAVAGAEADNNRDNRKAELNRHPVGGVALREFRFEYWAGRGVRQVLAPLLYC